MLIILRQADRHVCVCLYRHQQCNYTLQSTMIFDTMDTHTKPSAGGDRIEIQKVKYCLVYSS